MNFEPFDTSLVVARIRERATGLRFVGGSADYAAVKSLLDFAPPAAYVMFATESAGNVPGPRGARVQPAQADFGVALAVRNYREQRGAQLGSELRTLLGQVRDALIGWVPPTTGATAVQWTGGAVMDYDDAMLLWVDVYSCTHLLQR